LILNRFPWIWSPAEAAEPPPPPPPPPFWTKDTPGAMAYQSRAAQLLPRFEHIYPESSDFDWTKKNPV